MTVAFIGHREIDMSNELREKVIDTVTRLIQDYGAHTFLFGSAGEFDELCYGVVSDIKKRYRYIRRVYVRAEYPDVRREFLDYLLTFYDDTFFPNSVRGANRLAYVKRNEVMVDLCDVLVAYCDEKYEPKYTRSGTKMAVSYACEKHKRVINLHE